MTAVSRRIALSLAFSSLVGLVSPLSAAPRLSVPRNAMRLSRRLKRGLSDGNAIVVERSWLIEFEQRAQAIAITGRQIEAQVDAPLRIARLASVERERSTDAMFPIVLDSAGQMVAAGPYSLDRDVETAIQLAEEIIARSQLSAAAKGTIGGAVASLQHAGLSLLDSMPPDLFFPRGTPWHTLRKVNLPDGNQGEFEVAYSASPTPGRGWLSTARRDVTTRIGSSVSRSSETWALKPA